MRRYVKKTDEKRREQELAWIGDTVLDLFARTWILEKTRKALRRNAPPNDLQPISRLLWEPPPP